MSILTPVKGPAADACFLHSESLGAADRQCPVKQRDHAERASGGKCAMDPISSGHLPPGSS